MTHPSEPFAPSDPLAPNGPAPSPSPNPGPNPSPSPSPSPSLSPDGGPDGHGRLRATSAPRLIATDLDGTLLRNDKTVSARTIAALAAAEDAGIEVFFVTGRPARWMGVVSEHVHGHGLAICANGAAVVDLHAEGQRIVRVRELARTDALAVVHALRSAAPGVTFAVERTEGIHYEPGYPSFSQDPGTSYAPVDELLAEGTETGADPMVKLLAHHPEMDADEFLALGRKTAGTHAEFTRSSPSALLEISGRGVSKASTLALACEERGITPEEVVAFGDMPNDLEMLAWAGTSYAMANAHPDVRVSTTHTTSTNEEDGVATVIETYV